MTYLKKVMADNPNLSPEMVVLTMCPADFGLEKSKKIPPCPEAENPCRVCWLRTCQEDAV